MNNNKKGYWVYSIIVVIVFVMLFAFVAYLICDVIIKISKEDVTNNTVLQAVISFFITVLFGGYFSKWLEMRNAKKLEIFKVQKEICLNVIDCATMLYYHPENSSARELLISESHKIKLYFDNKVLLAVNKFVESSDKHDENVDRKNIYEQLIDELRGAINI